MDLKKNTLIIGLGNCGCKIAKQFADIGYETIFANGSEQDLKVLGNIKGIYKLEGFDGFGGHRDRAMSCLQENSEFVDALCTIKQKIIFIIYATGGSTGSGLSTIVAEWLQGEYDNEKIICTVPVLPAENESINKHMNAFQAITELMELDGMGATFVLDNNKSDNGDLRWINKSFLSMLDAFLTDDSWGEPNNFDESERMEMLKEPGNMIISLCKDGITKIREGNIFAPLQNDKVCGNIGIIHSGRNDIDINELVAEVGKPLNISEGWGGKCTLIAVSGMSFPVDHVSRLGNLAVEGQKERQRNVENAKAAVLPTLDFGVVKTVKPIEKAANEKKKLSNREMLMAMRKKS